MRDQRQQQQGMPVRPMASVGMRVTPSIVTHADVRPTPADLEAARDASIGEVIASDLAVLFCGINPSLWSGATGHHFARPGNRFWPTLYRSGFTPHQLRPDQQDQLPTYGLGICNLVDRATARADELSPAELKAGAERLEALVRRWHPQVVAVVGITAYRTAFGRPSARIGPQAEPLDAARLWVLPNPSGLNAHYQLAELASAFSSLRGSL